jgi:tRNA (guanine26-N2/guanine27-N2)-dimethyltransferase
LCVKDAKEAEKLIEQHKYILYNPETMGYEISDNQEKKGFAYAGPLFVGELNDKKLIKKMLDSAEGEAKKILNLIYNELNNVGCYDIHELCSKMKICVPNFKKLFGDANATRTHYNDHAIKTKISVEELKKIILSI